MEASVVAAPEEPVVAHDGEAEATRSAEELFQWSGYVHVGTGAQECEHAQDGECAAEAHFHAWLCLPNQFQIRDIGEKARAARARIQRALRDHESDSRAILEAELEDLRDHYDALVDSMAQFEADKRITDIMRELESDERFEHHAQDAEEYTRLNRLSPTARDVDEFQRLEADVTAFNDGLRQRMDAAREAEKTRLLQMDQDEVIELERRHRMDAIGTEAYLHSYYTWCMYVCARKPQKTGFPRTRVFRDPEELRSGPPEVIAALRQKIAALENRTATRSDAAGN
jgi:hypothetical protein